MYFKFLNSQFDFEKILGMFHMESPWNPHGIHVESMWNPSGIHVE